MVNAINEKRFEIEASPRIHDNDEGPLIKTYRV